MDQYPTSTKIILLLKEQKNLSLEDLSTSLGISKVAVLNHLKVLEQQGIVTRKVLRKNIGRPVYLFSVNNDARGSLGSSADVMLEAFMNFLKNRGMEATVKEFLEERYKSVFHEYFGKLSSLPPEERVRMLTLLRQKDNYYPEMKNLQGDYELSEFNCPILSISKNFGFACSMETNLFERLLDTGVSSTHRQVDGSGVCRFLIRKKEE